jgi:tetratricopeptide (TPR) repeat protein
LHGPFVFDDYPSIRDNPLIRDLANYLASWTGYRGMPNRFLAYLTFALNYRLGGLEVVGYHAFNLGVHLACALLVYAFVVLTFRTPRVRGSSLAPCTHAVAFAASALFVTHPIQTQAVTYVVQRITTLATLFYILSIVLYARWRLLRETQPRRGAASAAPYVLALLSAVAAMKTKEIAFTLPFAIVLYELVFFERQGPRLRFLAPFLATCLIIPVTVLNLNGHGGGVLAGAGASTRAESELPRLDYLITETAVVARYLRLLVLPVGQNFHYDFPIYRSFLAPRVLSSLAVLVALLAGAAWLYRRSAARGARTIDPAGRIVSFGVAWFFLAHLVESSLIPIDDVINEHRVYLPSIGLFAGVASGGALLLRRVPRSDTARLTALAAVLLATVLAVTTLRRNEVWSNDVSLWADTVSKSPTKLKPLGHLAVALAAAGRPEEGVLALRRAVTLEPRNAIARLQLGAALAALGRTAEAEPELREAIRLDPKRPEPVFNLALLLSRTGRPEEAKEWFRRFLEIAPSSYAGLRQIATAYAGPQTAAQAGAEVEAHK